METFEELMATDANKGKLADIIRETPELMAGLRRLVALEKNVHKAVDEIVAFGSFGRYNEWPTQNKRAIYDDLAQASASVINRSKLFELADMATDRLYYEAYKILCEREGSE